MPTPQRRLTDLLAAINPTLQFLPGTLSRYRRLLTGRHHVHMQTIPTVTGYWAWKAICRTCELTRASAEATQAAAITAAHQLLGERDHYTWHELPYCNDPDLIGRLTDAGHPPVTNWTRLGRVQLPANLAGDGYTVATDGSAPNNNPAIGWAYMTNAGWCSSGTITTDTPHRTQAGELLAIDHALRMYPHGSTITVLFDNTQVGALVQDLVNLARTGRKLETIPKWAIRANAAAIKGSAHNNDIRLLWTRSTTNKLHNLADTLARAATGTRAKYDWKPLDVERIGHTCGPSCPVIHIASGSNLHAA